MFVVTEQHGKGKRLSIPPQKKPTRWSGQSSLSWTCDMTTEERQRERQVEEWSEITPHRTSRCHLSQQERERDTCLTRLDMDGWHKSAVWKVFSNHLLTFLFCCPHPYHAVQLFRPCLPHMMLHFARTVLVTSSLIFFPLAVDTNEVHLTGKACQVQRQRRLMMDQSPMTHSSICDPRR